MGFIDSTMGQAVHAIVSCGHRFAVVYAAFIQRPEQGPRAQKGIYLAITDWMFNKQAIDDRVRRILHVS